MPDSRTVRNDEAMELLRTINSGDRVTSILVNYGLFHFIRRFHAANERPVCDFDLLYFMELMHVVFSKHDLLRRMLGGERVGAFFDDDDESEPV